MAPPDARVRVGRRYPSMARSSCCLHTTQTQPEAATRWSVCTVAKQAGASAATISRIWSVHGNKPDLGKTFKVST